MTEEIPATMPDGIHRHGKRRPTRPGGPATGRRTRVTLLALVCVAFFGGLPPLQNEATRPVPGAWTGPFPAAYASDGASEDGFVSGTDDGGGGDEKSSSTRSIFLSLFATHFIPGIAEGLSNWFSRRMFGGEGSTDTARESAAGTASATVDTAPGTTEGAAPAAPGLAPAHSLAPAQGPAPANAPATTAVASAAQVLHAGIAYEVLLLGPNGERSAVDAQQHVFRSGERFEVAYRPNFPGRVDVYNIDPAGQVTLIDRLTLQAAELGTLGPYEFVGEKGEDLLRIVLHPCRAPASTRSIRRIEMRKEVERVLGDCADAPSSQQARVATRSIAKVAREGGTAYALDPVQKSELDSGRLQPREIVVRFRHE
ncbi:MAG: hypothetical protein AB7P21_17500 [Lautropia sp.]